MVREYGDNELLNRVRNLPGFTLLPKYLLIGVRSNEDAFNSFDDKFYFFIDGAFVCKCTGTTNPGDVSLLGGWKRFNNRGSAILKADEIYYDCYRYGLHKGKMPALRQVKAMKYYRDNNNDRKVDETGVIYTENAMTNFHFADYNILTKIIKRFIGGWSEGCQVCNQSEGYNIIINEAKKSVDSFTYALLKEF